MLKDLGAMIEQEIRSIQLATLDELTMISNRRGFLTLADHSQKLCQRKKMPMSIILFDLNKFKAINDEYGHHEGDFVLNRFAEVMQHVFRQSDVIGRLGGDEFVVMLTDSDHEQIGNILDRFSEAIEETNTAIDKPYNIEFSAGVANFSHDTQDSLEEMIEQADAAMYQQKKTAAR